MNGKLEPNKQLWSSVCVISNKYVFFSFTMMEHVGLRHSMEGRKNKEKKQQDTRAKKFSKTNVFVCGAGKMHDLWGSRREMYSKKNFVEALFSPSVLSFFPPWDMPLNISSCCVYCSSTFSCPIRFKNSCKWSWCGGIASEGMFFFLKFEADKKRERGKWIIHNLPTINTRNTNSLSRGCLQRVM